MISNSFGYLSMYQKVGEKKSGKIISFIRLISLSLHFTLIGQDTS